MPKSRLAPFLLALALSPPAIAQSPVPVVAPNSFTLLVQGSVVRIPYYRNLALDGSYPQAVHAVVLLHGDDRTANDAYDTLLEAADKAGEGAPTTLLIAPQFLMEVDVAFHGLGADYAYWSDSGWKQGDRSQTTAQHPRPVRVSSFAVMDTIVHRLAARNPNLVSIVVAGHSAGGQFVNRYAAGNRVEPIVGSQFGTQVSYVVANPSSYLYFDARRVVPGTSEPFAIPSPATVQSCPDYDDYKYGLMQLNSYMAAVSIGQIRSQYGARRVRILLGEADNDPNSPTLDRTCAAALQGPYRLARGLIYFNYVIDFFGSPVLGQHDASVVPGVGHTSHGMFTSDCGVTVLFSEDSCHQVTGFETAEGAAFLRVQSFPNPFRSSTQVFYRVAPGGERSTLRIYDLRGRVVRTLADGARGSGEVAVRWDGRSDAGRPVAAGVYVVRLQQGAKARAQKLTRLP